MMNLFRWFGRQQIEADSGAVNGFRVLHKAWYAEAPGLIDASEISIGVYYPDGSTGGEFGIAWKDVRGKSVPRLEAYSDSWKALATMTAVHDILRKAGHDLSPDWVAAELIAAGYTDLTAYVQPE